MKSTRAIAVAACLVAVALLAARPADAAQGDTKGQKVLQAGDDAIATVAKNVQQEELQLHYFAKQVYDAHIKARRLGASQLNAEITELEALSKTLREEYGVKPESKVLANLLRGAAVFIKDVGEALKHATPSQTDMTLRRAALAFAHFAHSNGAVGGLSVPEGFEWPVARPWPM